MTDIQRILEEIQSALQSPQLADHEYLRDVAVSYSVACDEVNGRLRECAQLLRRGLRSEAIQAAEREPNLLDSVGMLDFAELPLWRCLLERMQMVMPTPIQIELAGEINEAYASVAPLTPLLKYHRLLAIARAPFASRINILRQLCQADPANPAWPTDLQAMETARIRQLATEAEAAYKAGNLPLLQQIQTEVNDVQWRVRPPGEVVATINQRSAELAARHAEALMERLAAQLDAAYAAFDVPAAQQVRDQWQKALPIARLMPNHSLLLHAAPALTWLAEQEMQLDRTQSFEAATANLTHALDEDAKRDVLERLYNQVIQFDEGIDPLLERRYRERVHSFELAARRKFGLSMAGVAGLLAVVAALTVWVIIRQQTESRTVARVAGLKELVDTASDPKSGSQSLDEAEKYLQQSHEEGFGDDPRIQQLAAQLRDLQAQEANRRKQFADDLQRVEAAGLDQPDYLSLDDAEKVSRFASEREQVAIWRAKLRTAEREAQQARDQAFLEKYKSLRDQVEKLDGEVSDLKIPPSAELSAVLANINEMLSRSGMVTTEFVSQAKTLKLRAQALSDQVHQIQRQADAVKLIGEAVGDPLKYKLLLEGYAKDFPAAGESLEIRKSLTEATIWEGTEQWRTFLANKRWHSLVNLTPEQAKQLSDECKAMQDKYGAHPASKVIDSKLPVIAAIAARLGEGDKTLVQNAKDLFSDKLILDIWMLKTKKGKCYYSLRKIDPDDKSVTGKQKLTFVGGFDLSEQKTTLEPDLVDSIGEAPHSLLAKKVLAKLNEVTDFTWEVKFYEICQMIVDDTQVDPVLRLMLLKRVFSLAGQGSNSFKVVGATVLEAIEKGNVDLTVNWLSPDDVNADPARSRAKTLIGFLPKMTDIRSRLQSKLAEDVAPVAQLPEWKGWLWKSARGTPQIRAFEPQGLSGEMLVLNANQNPPVFAKVANLESGVLSWDNGSAGQLFIGRPIYFRAASAIEKTTRNP